MDVDQTSKEFNEACRAFWQGGPPGVLRRLQNVDSYPGARLSVDDPSDPEAYRLLSTTVQDERQAIVDVIAAFLEAGGAEAGSARRQLICLECRYQGDRTFVRDNAGVWRDALGGERGLTPDSVECGCGSRALRLVPAVSRPGREE